MKSEENNSNKIVLTTEMQQWMFQKKVRMLYRNQTQSGLLSIMASAIIAYLSIDSSNIIAGFAWWFGFVAVMLLRTWNTFQFHVLLDSAQTIDYKYWYKRFFIGAVFAGLGWTAGAFIVGCYLDSISQIFIFIILIGVGSAAIPLLGIFQNLMISFQLLSTMPFVIYVAVTLQDRGVLLMVLFALYMVAILLSIRRMDASLSESLSLQYENTRIVSSLSESNQELQFANEKLETLTLEDELTGLYNRRYFEMQLKAEWKRETREQKVLTLMVIDIDYFKLYNDTYGHAEGDTCLKRVAQVLKSCLNRPADIVARIGGEEFVMMLPDVDVKGVLTLAQQIKEQLQHAALTHGTSPLGENLTVSIGAASVIPGEDTTALGLFKAADKALYKAKAKGRNQVVIGEMDLT